MNNNLLANAIGARIAPYLQLTNQTNQMKNYDENNNGLHNLSFGLMNGSINNSMNNNLANNNIVNSNKTNSIDNNSSTKTDLKSNDKLVIKKEDDLHFNHLQNNNSIKSSNFNLLYPTSNFNLTSLLKN